MVVIFLPLIARIDMKIEQSFRQFEARSSGAELLFLREGNHAILSEPCAQWGVIRMVPVVKAFLICPEMYQTEIEKVLNRIPLK